MSVPVPPVETGPGSDLSLASSLSRKCTNCGRTGHNSRTCLESREAPAGSLDARTASEVINFVAEQHRQQLAEKGKEEEDVGAASDQESAGNNQRERKKGIAWTEEEHRLFLLGLQKLGKGDWRGISRHYVQTRSPTQVASHAQKYFIRQSVAGKRKRRSSLFDLVPEANQEGEVTSVRAQPAQAVKEETRAAAPPQMEPPHNPMPGMMQSAGAIALAYWYQMMMAQQNPMAWIQAMYPQGPQGQMNSPPSMAPFMAPGQSLVPPPMMQQPGFPSMPAGPPYTAGQPPNLAAQGHALANAYMAQQQQIAAAIAMGVMPFTPEAMAATGAALQHNTTNSTAGGERPEESMPPAQKSRTDRRQQQQQQLQQRSLSSEQESRSPHHGQPGFPASIKQEQAYPDVQQQQSGCELANERHLNYSHLRSDPPPESFGNGALVRPLAHKACPAQSYGELPSYMLGSQDTSSRLGSTSADSHSTGLRVSTYRPSSGFGSTPEFSGSTNGGFTGSSGGALTGLAARLAADAAAGGHDEGSNTGASKLSKQARADIVPAATSA